MLFQSDMAPTQPGAQGMDPTQQQNTTTTPQATTTDAGAAPPATTPQQAAPPAPPALPPEVTAELEALRKQAASVTDLQKQVEALKSESAKRRIETKQEKEAREAEARRAGDLQTLTQSLDEKLAELAAERDELTKQLESLRPDAEAQKKWRDGKVAKLTEAAAKLTTEQRAVFDAIPTVEAKALFMKTIAAVAPPTPPKEPEKKPADPAPPAGTPAAGASLSWADMSLDQLKDMKDSNPEGFDALTASKKPTASNPLAGFLRR